MLRLKNRLLHATMSKRQVQPMNMHGLEPRMQLNIRVDREDKESLEKLAKAEGRTLSDYVRHVLEQHLEEKGLK